MLQQLKHEQICQVSLHRHIGTDNSEFKRFSSIKQENTCESIVNFIVKFTNIFLLHFQWPPYSLACSIVQPWSAIKALTKIVFTLTLSVYPKYSSLSLLLSYKLYASWKLVHKHCWSQDGFVLYTPRQENTILYTRIMFGSLDISKKNNTEVLHFKLSIVWMYCGINKGELQFGIMEWMCLKFCQNMSKTYLGLLQICQKVVRRHIIIPRPCIKAYLALWCFLFLCKGHSLSMIVWSAKHLLCHHMTLSQSGVKRSNLPKNY